MMTFYLSPFADGSGLSWLARAHLNHRSPDFLSPGESEEGHDQEGAPGQTREAQRQHAGRLEAAVRGLQVGPALQTVIPQRAAVLSEGVALLQQLSAELLLSAAGRAAAHLRTPCHTC